MTDDYSLGKYPTEEQLEKVRTWSALDGEGLIRYLEEIWRYPDMVRFHLVLVEVSTGGWSGNEDIIGAMQENIGWWGIHWLSSRRGGHYEFERREPPSSLLAASDLDPMSLT